MPNTLALIPVDLSRSALGLPSRLEHRVAGRSVLAHTLARVDRISSIQGIVLIHPRGQQPLKLVEGMSFRLPVHAFEVDAPSLQDTYSAMRVSARKIAPSSWRGGLGSTTCYDEILYAREMANALKQHQGDSAVLIGADWLLVDPVLTREVLAIHLESPDTLQMTFSQAAPGLTGIAISRVLFEQLASSGVHIGHLLAYNPQKPQADPIGKDVCLQIPPQVRDCPHRLIYDLPRSAALIDQLADHWDATTFASADALQTVTTLATLSVDDASFLPREVTLELTPRRTTNGLIMPQHHVSLDRPDLSVDDALTIVRQLGRDGDTLLRLGGLGDALLHPQWDVIVQAAHDAGVWGIIIDTDLLVDQPTLEKLLSLPVDAVHVRLNADTSATYRAVMTHEQDPDDHFKRVLENLQWLLNTRNARWQKPQEFPAARAGAPWIVPSLIKTAQTFRDMETFFDRWMVYTSHAVIAPPQTGCGLMPDQEMVKMTPPRRRPCRQLASRLTIHSNGQLAQCDQDWLGRGSVGDARTMPLPQLVQQLIPLKEKHLQGQWDESPLCTKCDQWHRP